jgi:hypothetical protein
LWVEVFFICSKVLVPNLQKFDSESLVTVYEEMDRWTQAQTEGRKEGREEGVFT